MSLQSQKSSADSDPACPDQARSWIQPYYSCFNGLRGLAVSAVFFHHYAQFWGLVVPQFFLWMGVDLFFVLSGFLITGILYDSLHNPHFFRDFYVRRALRIFPLYYGIFLLLLVLTPLLHLSVRPLFWTYAAYCGNLVYPFQMEANVNISSIVATWHGQSRAVVEVGHFWSLCVEEQFYLIWPAVVWIVRDRRRLMLICAVFCLLALPLRLFLHEHYNYFFLLYESTYTRYDTLLVGAWMALWLRGASLSRHHLRRLSFWLFWPAALVVVFMVLRLPRIDSILVQESRFVTTAGFTLIAVAFAGVILRSLDATSRLSRLMTWRPLSALGAISYGFYLIHSLFGIACVKLAHTYPRCSPWIPPVAFVLTVGLSWLSFHYLESPFLRLKRVLAPQAGAPLHVSQPLA